MKKSILVCCLVLGGILWVNTPTQAECCKPYGSCSTPDLQCQQPEPGQGPCNTLDGTNPSSWHCVPITASNPEFRLPKYSDIGVTLTPLGGGGAFKSDIGRILTSGLQYFFAMVGVLFLIYMLYGGFSILIGFGNEQSVANGQKIMSRALMGLIIMFVSFWMVELLELVLGINIL